MSWLAALGMVLVLAAGAAAPGRVAAGLEAAVTERLPLEGRWRAAVEADPFLDLPRGLLPGVRLEGRDVPLGPFRWPLVEVQARELRVPGPALWGLAPPRLLAPAPARVRLTATDEALTLDATRVVASGQLAAVPVPRGPVRLSLGATVGVEALRIAFAPAQVTVSARLRPARGTPKAWSVSFTPTCVEGRRLRVTGLQLAVDGRPLPGALTSLASRALPPLLDLEAWPALGPEWRIERFEVSSGSLELEAAGPLPVAGP